MSIVAVSFALYTLLVVGVGLYSARFSRKSDDDYFLAGRSLGPWMAALSASASGSSGWVTMGLVGLGFTSGVRAYWLVPGVLIGIAFNWLVLTGRLSRRAQALGAVTLPDMLAFHFRERLPLLRSLSVLVILVAMFLYVAAQLAAAGKAFDATFDGVSYQWGVVIGTVIVLAYTVIGGFRAACWTDFLQAIMMLVTLAGLPIYLVASEGGFGALLGRLEQVDPALVQILPDVTGVALIGFLFGSSALGVNLGYPGQPHVLVRYMALRDPAEARLGAAIALSWSTLTYAGAVTVGIVARVLAEGGASWGSALTGETGDPELALVVSSIELLPGVLSGMALAAILAAIASTADSQLVVAASSVASDLYARLIAPTRGRSHWILDRVVVLALGAAAGALVIDQEIEVYNFVIVYGWAMLGAAFGPQVILMLLWRRSTYSGCLAGMLTGFSLTIIWKLVYEPEGDGPELYNLTIAFAAALVVNVIVSLLTARRAVATDHSEGQGA